RRGRPSPGSAIGSRKRHRSAEPVFPPVTTTLIQSMYVQKVRLTRSNVSVEYKTPTGESHAIECADAPLPSFVKAVHALVALILDVLHLPSEYGEHLTPTGLTLTDKQEAKLVTITGKKDLPDAHAPFNIATPLRFLEHPETEGSYSPPL